MKTINMNGILKTKINKAELAEKIITAIRAETGNRSISAKNIAVIDDYGDSFHLDCKGEKISLFLDWSSTGRLLKQVRIYA